MKYGRTNHYGFRKVRFCQPVVISLVMLLILVASSASAQGTDSFYPITSAHERPFTRIVGVNYGPFRVGEQPGGRCPTRAGIAEDLSTLSPITTAIRTYGLHDCKLASTILDVAKGKHVRVVLGLWLGPDDQANEQELAELEMLVRQGLDRLAAVVVGNEVLLRQDMSLPKLLSYIRRVKEIVKGIPVTTSEPWNIWLGLDRAFPNIDRLISNVDFVFANIHPYWDGACINQAANAALNRFRELQRAYPKKQTVIGETGWPTSGMRNGCAIPSVANQQTFYEEFLCKASEASISYFVFAAFDEPYKSPPVAEAHWGFYNVDRKPKYDVKSLRCLTT